MMLRVLSILLLTASIFPVTSSQAQFWKKLTLDELPRNSRFGNDLAIADDYLIVAASGDSTNGREAGAVIVYDLSKSHFPVHQKILRVPGIRGSFFGRAFEAEDQHLFVTDRGARSIQYYKLVSGRYEAMSTLQVPNLDYARFSYQSLELNGNWLFITAKDISYSDSQSRVEGAVFLFKYENGLWNYHSRIEPEEWNVPLDIPDSHICSKGNTLFVSSPTDSQAADQAGAVFVYKMQDGYWTYSNTLFSPDPQESDRFGFRIGCTESDLVVYASARDLLYSFKIDEVGRSPRPQRIVIPGSEDPYVLNIHFDEDILFVMTNNDIENGVPAGAIHVYTQEQGQWIFDSKIISPDRWYQDGFGFSIAMTSDLFIAGAAYEDRVDEDGEVLAYSVGAVYVAKREGILPDIDRFDSEAVGISKFDLVYPNPASTSAVLKYAVEEPSQVELLLFDLLGRPIKWIVNENRTSGTYTETIDVSNVPSGVYFYQIKIGHLTATKPLTVIH